MSLLRRTFPDRSGARAPTNGTAYLLIYNSVKAAPGLIHGQLDNAQGEHCAIGSYWANPRHLPLTESFIDEVAAVNDSVPHATPKARRTMVLRWLRWKVQEAGISLPGRKVKR